jgi:hypothetical protein
MRRGLVLALYHRTLVWVSFVFGDLCPLRLPGCKADQLILVRGWTLTGSLRKSSGWNECSSCRTPDHSAQATSPLPTEGTMTCLRTALGFGFGSDTESAAGPSPPMLRLGEIDGFSAESILISACGTNAWLRARLPDRLASRPRALRRRRFAFVQRQEFLHYERLIRGLRSVLS